MRIGALLPAIMTLAQVDISRARISTGQSARFLPRRLRVRIPPGTPTHRRPSFDNQHTLEVSRKLQARKVAPSSLETWASNRSPSSWSARTNRPTTFRPNRTTCRTAIPPSVLGVTKSYWPYPGTGLRPFSPWTCRERASWKSSGNSRGCRQIKGKNTPGPVFVILAKAGIQKPLQKAPFRGLGRLDSRFRGNDGKFDDTPYQYGEN